MSVAKYLPLNNGKIIPTIGLGTWKSEPGKVTQAVKDAIDIGVRHIDCAFIYGNEKEVGVALKEKISEGVIKREDVFITSKLWNTFHSPEAVIPALKESLKNLELDYLDLYLIHWPMGYKEGGALFPTVDGKVQFSDVDWLDTYKKLEEAVEAGLVKSIGVSNFNSVQLTRLLKACKVKPVVNQIELHPYLNQQQLRQFCCKNGVAVTAYSPLGSPDRPWATAADKKVLDDDWMGARAKELGKSPAQLMIRWNLQLGNIVIPKSVTKSRISENFNVYDFELTESDMAAINKLTENYRICAMAGNEASGHYPFNIEY